MVSEMDLKQVWSALRGLIKDSYTFNNIKEMAGASGLPIHMLSHLQQRPLPARSSSKSELLDASDGLLEKHEDPERVIRYFVREMLRRNARIEDAVSEVVQRFGWDVHDGELCHADLHVDEGGRDYGQEIQDGLARCTQRYRDGDYAGAITSVCGLVDSVTEAVYRSKELGDPYGDSYQQRVNRAFAGCEEQ